MAFAPVQDLSKVRTQFQQDLLALQIDTIFNGLVALIETERLKVKSLLDHSISHPNAASNEQSAFQETLQWQQDCEEEDMDIGRRIVECSESGMKPGEIARQLGISQAEVSLALKMLGKLSRSGPQKLEAVA